MSSTWISSSLKFKSGLAALTASLTASFSAFVKLFLSETSTFSFGSFKVLPVLSNGLTVSFPSNLPVLSPSVTVTLPLPSTLILSLDKPELAATTASLTASFSAGVRLFTSLTSTGVGLLSLIILLSSTTVLSAGTVPVLPPWLIVTLPLSSTVTSSGFRFKSGLAFIIASLTLPFSVSSKASGFLTSTGGAGGLILFITSFCLTVCSGVNSPVLPSVVFTVTLPSLPTVISSFVKLSVGLASITACLTASFSLVVRSVLSDTGTSSVGGFKFNFLSATCSQTAYTVFDSVSFDGSVTFASVASFVSAQPLNVNPSFVGDSIPANSSGFFVIWPSPSLNTPPFASSVTTVSSE